ncbi:MAG: hypothetical protein ABIB79_05230 [archaeon]
MNTKGFLNISFAWLFAIIAGAFILFLAIYAVTQIIGTSQYQINTETAKSIDISFNQVETSFESAFSTSLTLPVESRIYNDCEEFGNFGEQLISISEKNFGKWPTPPEPLSSKNRYIFSELPIQGKTFYLFSKPFNFPFKIADLIYMTSSTAEYCFKSPTIDIEYELESLNQPNLKIFPNCSEESVFVCFGPGNCDIKVNLITKSVEKDSEEVYFEDDALMYAAIFSDQEVYECQVKRLMMRTENLAQLYIDKSKLISRTSGCSSNLNLLSLASQSNRLDNSRYLSSIKNLVEDIQNQNELNRECKLW